MKPMDKKSEDDLQGSSRMIFQNIKMQLQQLCFWEEKMNSRTFERHFQIFALTHTSQKRINEKEMILYVLMDCPNLQL